MMKKIAIMNLTMMAPLDYGTGASGDPFAWREEYGEKLYRFTLDEKEAEEFEPDKENYFREADAPEKNELPAGTYFFAQERGVLSREDIAAMAVELQQELLWQKKKPGRFVYLRYLCEEGAPVTQVFRPYSAAASII
jgi:hypothetical protein